MIVENFSASVILARGKFGSRVLASKMPWLKGSCIANRMNLYTRTVIVGLAICFAGLLAALATLCRAEPGSLTPAALATLVALAGFLPPLWFSLLISNGSACQLAVVAWRFGVLLPALMGIHGWEGEERKFFLQAFLACYFIGLPLESWLLIREARKLDN